MSKRYSLSPLSIRQRLTLFICIFLLGIIAILGLISYIGVKKTALEVGKERLKSLTDQVSTMLAANSKSAIAPIRAAAAQPAIKKYL